LEDLDNMATSAATRFAQTRRQTVEGYKHMLEESHQKLCQMEEHLTHLVSINRQAEARGFEESHRIVPASIEAVGLATFKIPQGESWICERVSVGCGEATVPIYFYRDVVVDERLAEIGTTDANGRYSDSFANTLWMPERTDLLVVVATANLVHANLQVRVLKRVLREISEEESYVHAGGLDERGFDDEQAIWEAEEPGEPEPERHETIEPDPRPEPHFGQRVEEAVEHVVDTVSGIARPSPHFRTHA
jgi:hypothetical protein